MRVRSVGVGTVVVGVVVVGVVVVGVVAVRVVVVPRAPTRTIIIACIGGCDVSAFAKTTAAKSTTLIIAIR